jgi:hypothetical protein
MLRRHAAPARIVALGPLLLMAAARPAPAQQRPGAVPPPLLAPAPSSKPAPEIGLGATQLVGGALTTLGAGLVLIALASRARSAPLGYVGAAVAPGAGSWVVCAAGQSSPTYEGSCGPTFLGGYLGAIALGIPMLYVGSAALAPNSSDGGSYHDVGALFGAALGVVIGTAIGATIGWHTSKRRRAGPAPQGFTTPPPARADLDPYLDLRPRPNARQTSAGMTVPLLSLRF